MSLLFLKPLQIQNLTRKTCTFHQNVDGIDQNVPRGNLSENFPKTRNLTLKLWQTRICKWKEPVASAPQYSEGFFG